MEKAPQRQGSGGARAVTKGPLERASGEEKAGKQGASGGQAWPKTGKHEKMVPKTIGFLRNGRASIILEIPII